MMVIRRPIGSWRVSGRRSTVASVVVGVIGALDGRIRLCRQGMTPIILSSSTMMIHLRTIMEIILMTMVLWSIWSRRSVAMMTITMIG